MPNATFALTLGLAGCASAIAMPDTPPSPTASLSVATDADVAFARGRGPAALDELLVKYDHMHDGAARDALALSIDKVAAQRYATVSRLYWYTDLARAEAAAATQHKPILALRMLGNLDEDLSCANSRFFRASLYANKDLSAYMKQNFVLYWSSERAVPKVTIDFGDGRRIEGTTTGNSAHYILDEKGAVLDVIPGLYAPRAFRAELAASLAHAREVAAAPAHERGAKIIGYHQARLADLRKRASQLNVFAMRGSRVSAEDALSQAQNATISKGYVEVPQLRKITQAELTSIDDDEVSTWAMFANQLWPATPTKADKATEYERVVYRQEFWLAMTGAVFDEQSIALIGRIAGTANTDERNRMIARFARNALADSALNQLRLRVQIHELLAKGSTDFATINDAIYASVFHTPKSDPWLGLRGVDFSGLPNDGATMPAATAQR